MTLWHGRSARKRTGGRYRPFRMKRRSELGRDFHPVSIGPEKRKVIRTRGGHPKIVLLNAEFANVLDPKSRTVKRVSILKVKENPANPHFIQRNVLTRGAIIQTEVGLARVTSRPGQHGVVNAVLSEE